MSSPASRSLDHLRKKGYVCQVVEKWNSHAHIRQDLFGFIDILAMPKFGEEQGLIAIQATSTGNIASRMKKSLQNENLEHWLKCGNQFFVHGWSKKGPRGKRKTWQLTERFVLP